MPAPTIEAPEVVRLENVSKRFVVRKDNSLKERLVTLGRLGKRHREDFWALSDVSLSIRAGTTIGLIGHNGSGKSTLLKVIGGILDASTGSVRNRGRIAALLELGAGFHPDLTGRENVYLNASILGLSKTDTDARFNDILAFSGIGEFIDTQVKFYSSGMFVRLAFAVAVHTEPDILLVDEVLAVGDEAFQRKCLDKIREFQQQGCTIILVTHSLGQVTELCDRAVLLNQGQIVVDGDPSEAVAAFRDILEQRRLAEIGETQEPERLSGFLSVTATPTITGPKGEIMPGSDLTVDVTIRSSVSLADHVIALQLNNTKGQEVWGTTTSRLGVTLPDLIGDHTLRFTVRDARFGPGKYFVNLSIMDSVGTHVQDWLQAASFNGFDPKTHYGTISAEPVLEILD
ncbi:ABC-2 type transport system ATP-binding protein [Microbacteriaceae bacterium SG_E_30_P1]|uniref:ABC-2 type transport system ATP-binding protein n=1 Tax=Antiquaquibacter oligotrophicus TaxID=2880260 RepID=A0ABT6KPM2_9MICO|nr:ABC transporter ATP-binding protein [Antiquaquibacter oligotrophicus]MDH6181720.1 ABC-2 type transport system ATP-binding protein [Antiquaquibacter oligotrophicus]UDF12597.1 ABC transporter ATP-binding protein [Antiquaquibacter oligotrophicus]